MYTPLFDSDNHIDAILMDRKAAYQRIATRHPETEAAEILRHVERLNLEMVAREEGYRLARWFDSQRPPLLPARCITSTIATPQRSTITRHEAGNDGLLVSYAGKSVQATETTLAEAIAIVTKGAA